MRICGSSTNSSTLLSGARLQANVLTQVFVISTTLVNSGTNSVQMTQMSLFLQTCVPPPKKYVLVRFMGPLLYMYRHGPHGSGQNRGTGLERPNVHLGGNQRCPSTHVWSPHDPGISYFHLFPWSNLHVSWINPHFGAWKHTVADCVLTYKLPLHFTSAKGDGHLPSLRGLFKNILQYSVFIPIQADLPLLYIKISLQSKEIYSRLTYRPSYLLNIPSYRPWKPRRPATWSRSVASGRSLVPSYSMST